MSFEPNRALAIVAFAATCVVVQFATMPEAAGQEVGPTPSPARLGITVPVIWLSNQLISYIVLCPRPRHSPEVIAPDGSDFRTFLLLALIVMN